MPNFTTYNGILDNATEQEARDYAAGMVWSEVETTDETIRYADYIDTVDGTEIYYDYGADYFFFCPVEEEITK